MPSANNTKFQHVVFFLTGIPGQEEVYVWISIPFCMVYLTTIFGNALILFILNSDPMLHGPMFNFLSMLAITDLGLSISTMPTTLGIFMFKTRSISHDTCFVQLFFIHFLTVTESSVLLWMAFDRYVAISKPLRYESILTSSRIAKMFLISLLRGLALILPLPIFLKHHQYCKDSVLSHSYCLHQDVMNLACSDIRVNNIYGFFITIASVGLDLLLILLSYVKILHTVLNITPRVECFKALRTCISHICVVLVFYTPVIVLTVTYRLVKISSPLFQIIMGYVYLLVPPLMNPVVYSMKTKSIRVKIVRVFSK